MKIGIVGRGFVGSAVQFGFSPNTGCDAEVRAHDKDPNKSQHTLEEVVNESDYIFVSVPTPSNNDGSINLDIVDDVLHSINEINNRDNVILLRSTMVPGSTLAFQKKYPKLNIVFNPEFLTERSANFDFINQARFIVGGDSENTSKVAKLYRWRFGDSIPVIETNYQTAELIKYMNNCFFATKVSFMNEMRIVADKCGADWDKAVDGFIRDGRIGHSHLNVPGHDGKFGFGGSCFPKDIQALIDFGKTYGINLNTLSGAWQTNLEVRPEKDWEKLLGRAVVEDKK
jgi:nucleotide sugar dehydrogenase|tara:strand:- start:3154 stop:4008 length:855 start_codon:yes stop_codon:yes gene_type:complete